MKLQQPTFTSLIDAQRYLLLQLEITPETLAANRSGQFTESQIAWMLKQHIAGEGGNIGLWAALIWIGLAAGVAAAAWNSGLLPGLLASSLGLAVVIPLLVVVLVIAFALWNSGRYRKPIDQMRVESVEGAGRVRIHRGKMGYVHMVSYSYQVSGVNFQISPAQALALLNDGTYRLYYVRSVVPVLLSGEILALPPIT